MDHIEILLNKVVKEYSKIAGEPVTAKNVHGTIYVFGSELATLRLFREMPSRSQGYSTNYNGFYFCFSL